MKKNILITLLLLCTFSVFPQSKLTWFPSDLNIRPFTANFIEPKAGFAFQMGGKKIRLDISKSTEVLHLNEKNKTLSFGVDLFTFTRLRAESEFHFPVEAIDYLFGLNSGYKIINKNCEYGLRFRLSHISAHFVDGQYDYKLNFWRNGRTATVYTREFIELFPYYSFDGLRAYAGLTYLFHRKPLDIGKEIYQLGFDYYYIKFKNIYPYVAYDFKLEKINKFSGSNIITAGIKFGDYKSRGVSLAITYFAGKSVHGEYYDLNESYTTIGFNLDL
jgi:Protein of unknown function (DUF1207)